MALTCVCLCLTCQRGAPEDKDLYEEYLSQVEIQNQIHTVNGENKLCSWLLRPLLCQLTAGLVVSVHLVLEQVDEALDGADELALLAALQMPCLGLGGILTENGPWYLDQLLEERQQKALVRFSTSDQITVSQSSTVELLSL